MFAGHASVEATQSKSARVRHAAVWRATPIQLPSDGALLQRKDACACGGGCPRCEAASSLLQVSSPQDASELEADRIADSIMRAEDDDLDIGASLAESPRQSGWTHGGTQHAILRKGLDGGPCESAADEEQARQSGQEPEEQEPDTAMAKATAGTAPRGRLAVASLPARGRGSPLPAETRVFMESRFGHEFGSVCVHADSEADTLSRALSAEAFTVGTDVYFRAGRFQPTTAAGRHLLAHELAHVVQQRRGAVARHVQRFTLTGFPATEDAAMRTAIPIAS